MPHLTRSPRAAWICALLAVAACDGKDVALMPAGGPVDLGPGETFGDALPPADVNVPDENAEAGRVIPDALPFDALPISEPEAPSAPLLAEIRDFEGRFAMYARNLSTGGAVAHGAEEWLLAGPFMRLWPVALYAEKVATGAVDPESELIFGASFYRGDSKDLTPESFDKPFKLSRLASLTLLSANASAEELLLSALGGAPAVNRFKDAFEIEGMGSYLGPCERERAFWTRLDPRFDAVDCDDLSLWATQSDARGFVPAVFPEAPAFDEVQVEAAWTAMMDAHENAATARGIGETLARIHGHALPSDTGATTLRELLDHALGSGGGGNNLPDVVWISNLQGSVYNGRVWAGLVRGGEAPMALVLLSDRESGRGAIGERFDRAGMLAWEQLVGPIDLSAPAEAAAAPDWLGGIFIHEPGSSGACNADYSDDYEGLLACRRDNQRERFQLHESSAATIMVKDGPDVEATWLWVEPTGERHRYQVKIGPGGWWAWTRSFEAVAVGDWRLDVWMNGRPQRLGRFPVVE